MRYLEEVTHHNTQIVSTADLKTHLRITFSDDDSYIAALEKAAVHRIEEYTNLFLLTSEVVQYGEKFSDLNILYKSPVQSGGAVYYKKNGAWVEFDDIEFVYLIKPARIYQSEDSTLPEADDIFQAWKATYNVGFSTVGRIPDPLIQAIKIMVADMYENRQSVIVGKIVSEIPKTAEYLMNPYKIQTL